MSRLSKIFKALGKTCLIIHIFFELTFQVKGNTGRVSAPRAMVKLLAFPLALFAPATPRWCSEVRGMRKKAGEMVAEGHTAN
jgi:hypothetical protein